MSNRPPINETSCQYAALRNGQPEHRNHPHKNEVDAILDRYASVWWSRSPFESSTWEPDRLSVDSISKDLLPGVATRLRYHSYIAPNGNGPWQQVQRVAAYPSFARLNYVKQLSTTNIGLNIGATHNRLAHLLGTLDICGALLQEACESADKSALPDPPEATATLLLALLHDAYHGPFGHSLDRIGDLVVSDEGDSRIDKAILAEEIDDAASREGDLWSIVESLAKWMVQERTSNWRLRISSRNNRLNPLHFADQIIEFLAQLIRPGTLAKVNPKKFWLRELIDSAIDADRLDYLMRDTEALHWRAQVRTEDVTAMIKGVRVLPGTVSLPLMEQPFRKVSSEVHRLHWDLARKSVVEDLLRLRSELYAKVYEAPEKRAFDEMLAHALVWILRKEVESNPERLTQVLQRVALITDDELFHFLYELGCKPSHMLAMTLVHDLAVGRAFTEVWRCGIPLELLQAGQKRMLELASLWHGEELSLRKEVADLKGVPVGATGKNSPPMVQLLPRLKNHLEISTDKDFQPMIYFLCALYGKSFKSREYLERILWDELFQSHSDPGLGQSLKDELFETKNRILWDCLQQSEHNDNLWMEMQHTPLIFLSIPWVPHSSQDLDLANWEQQEDIVFHLEGVRCEEEKDIARRIHQEMYPISVFLPATLVDSNVRRRVGDLMHKLIWSIAWFRPEEVINQNYEWWSDQKSPEYYGDWVIR
jgi:HD superfamily phosphohydrolase